MAERPLKVGDPIPGRNVNSLTIGIILDPPVGHLLVDEEEGNLHTYWYHWMRIGGKLSKVLTHHGGPTGYDVQKGIDQHHIVIDRYLGVETQVESEDAENQPLIPPFNLRTYAQALRIGYDTLEIPGEKRWVGEALFLVDRAVRGATIKMPAAELQARLSSLTILQDKFIRSSNPFMQQTSLHLLEAVDAAQKENRDETMVSLLGMQLDLNKRAQEINEILAATIKRVGILENVRNRSEDLVTGIHFDLLRAKEKWDQAANDAERERVILNITNLLGVRRLSELRVQPFRKRAQRRPLVRLNRLGDYFSQGDFETVGRIFTEGAKDLIRWRDQIKKRVEGEYQMRFPHAARS